MNYKETYNELKNFTNDFTNEGGIFSVQSRLDLANAIDILKQAYDEVENLGLDYNNRDDDGLKYKISFSKIKLDECVTLHKNESQLERDMDNNVEKLKEEIQKHDTLNPDLWDENNELLPEVKEKLEDIVKHFDDALKSDGVELDILDVVVIGSNASYNYNDASDIDLHIIADTSIYDDEELALKVYLAYKSLFNNKYDPMIRNHEVEIYVEPHEVHANSKGIYSLNNGWLKEPENEDIPDIEQSEVEDYLAPFKERYEEVIENGSIEDVDKLIDDIYLERQTSIIKDGEFAIPNLAFKEFRAQGYLQNLRDRKVELENEAMSLDENDRVKESIISLFVDDDSFKVNESLIPADLKPGDILSNGRDEIEIIEINDDSILYNYNPLNSNRYTATDPIESFIYMINNFDFSKKLKEELEEVGNGIEFRFPEVEDTLKVFLDWEGVYGYNDDILEYADTTEEDLASFLEYEGIFGLTGDIWNILKGGKTYVPISDVDEFYRFCYECGVNPTHATLYDGDFNDGETITEDLPDLPDWLPSDDPNFVIRDIVKKAKERHFDLERVFNYELRDGKLKDIDDFSLDGKHYKRSGRGWIITLDNGNTVSATNTGAAGEIAKFFDDRLKESAEEKKVKARIAATDEFDNGYVFFNYDLMTNSDAEERAKKASIESPNRIFYVKYDDIMNPASDLKWVNGKSYTSYDDALKASRLNEGIKGLGLYDEFYEPSEGGSIKVLSLSGDGDVEYLVQPGDGSATFKDESSVDDLINELDKYGYKLCEDADELEDEPDWLVKWGKDPLNRLIGDRDTGSREVRPGINWTWFWTDNKKDAIRWFKQLTGVLPYESTLVEDGKNWGFRLQNEFVNTLTGIKDDVEDWLNGNKPEYWDDDYVLPEELNESYLNNSDEYVIDKLKNDLLYNYRIKPADIVKKGDNFLIVFFTKEDKDKVMNRPDMLSPVMINGELGYPYRFGSIDINAMRKANNPKYDRIIRGYDEYALQKKYNDFSIHSIDDVAEDELEEAFVLSIDDIKDEFKKMIDKHPEWSIEKAIEFAGDVLLDRGVSYKDLYKAKEEFEISLKEDYVLVRLSSGSRHNNKVEYSIEKVEAHKPDGGAITWGRHNEHIMDRMPSQIIASSDSKEELELKARELVEKIIKVDGKYQVQSEKGRNMGTYDTKKEAEDRLKEVEMFKHLKESSSSASDWVQEVSLSELDDIIEDRSPRGLFLSKDGDKYIAVDNSSYDAWTEEFYDREDAIAFLMKESLSEDVGIVTKKFSSPEDSKEFLTKYDKLKCHIDIDDDGHFIIKYIGDLETGEPDESHFAKDSFLEEWNKLSGEDYYTGAEVWFDGSTYKAVYDGKEFKSSDIDELLDQLAVHKDSIEYSESLNEEIDEDDERGKALADYLGLGLDELDYIASDRYETEGQGSIYFVVTKDEAKYYAKEIIEDIIFDVGPSAFTKDFQKFIYNECVNEADVDEFINNEIKYFSSIEDEQDMVDYLKGLNTGEKVQYIIDTLGKDDFNDWLFLGSSKINFDKLVDEAIKKDGLANFLADYDHKEIDLGNGLYAYRAY